MQAYQHVVVADAERALQCMAVHNFAVSSSVFAVVWEMDVPKAFAALELVRTRLNVPEGQKQVAH